MKIVDWYRHFLSLHVTEIHYNTCIVLWPVGELLANTLVLVEIRRSLTCSSRYPILWVSLILLERRVRNVVKDSPLRKTTICAESGAMARSRASSFFSAPTISFPFTSKTLKTISTLYHTREHNWRLWSW